MILSYLGDMHMIKYTRAQETISPASSTVKIW